MPIIAICGYTNAGKSTMLNALTEGNALAADKLFATLDPISRRLRFPQEREVVITDTVGSSAICRRSSSRHSARRSRRWPMPICSSTSSTRAIRIAISRSAPSKRSSTISVSREKPRILVWNKADRLEETDAEHLAHARRRLRRLRARARDVRSTAPGDRAHAVAAGQRYARLAHARLARICWGHAALCSPRCRRHIVRIVRSRRQARRRADQGHQGRSCPGNVDRRRQSRARGEAQGGYGVADLEHGAKVTPATRFEIASMSKMFIAGRRADAGGRGQARPRGSELASTIDACRELEGHAAPPPGRHERGLPRRLGR